MYGMVNKVVLMGANAVHAVHSEQLGAEIPIWNGCRLLETHPAGPY